MATKRKPQPTCKVPGCGNATEGGFRGACAPCYRTLARQVQLGEITWDELVAKGWVLPDARGRKPQTAAAKLLESIKQ
jgi:hypothetical protein